MYPSLFHLIGTQKKFKHQENNYLELILIIMEKGKQVQSMMTFLKNELFQVQVDPNHKIPPGEVFKRSKDEMEAYRDYILNRGKKTVIIKKEEES